MLQQDPTRRLIAEFRGLALDLAGRMPGIHVAMKLKPALFSRDKVLAVADFAQEGQRQRGGSASVPYSNAGPQQVADELAASISRIESLAGKLSRGRFGRDALVLAGLSVRAASLE